MKTVKKVLIFLMVVITISLIVYETFSALYPFSAADFSLSDGVADYDYSEWNKDTDGDGNSDYKGYLGMNGLLGERRTPWPLQFSTGNNYGMYINFATFMFNNVYCIQKDYTYNSDDHFRIEYGIEIEGNNATLYYGNWSNDIGTWNANENNIMAGIISAGTVWKESEYSIRTLDQWRKRCYR